MRLVERHIIKDNRFEEVCHKSGLLYNYVLYNVRQGIFSNSYLKEYEFSTKLNRENQFDFRNLPSSISQQVIAQVFSTIKGWMRSVKEFEKSPSKFHSKPKLPKYKSSKKQNMIVFTTASCRVKQDGYIHFIKNIIQPIKTNVKKEELKQVRIVPQATCYVVEVIYERKEQNLDLQKDNFLSIDLGLNNLCTCTNNVNQMNKLKNFNNVTGKMIISTDWHLKPSNIEEITKLQRQELNVAEDNGITDHVWLGDIFDSRISQRQDVLNAFSSILDMYARMEHKIYCIPGNHDKSDYSSDRSFLDAFKYHKGFRLITDLDAFEIGGVICYFMPFFDNAIWLKGMGDVLKEKNHKTHVLFTHIAFQGSRNNDGSEVESDIKPSLFKNFGMVFSGHYHDFQEIGKNIVHLGSITQNNFGEDEKKGFWILDDDLTYSFIPSKGKRYRKVTVNLENTTFKQADKIIKDFQKKNKGDFIRVEFVGTKDAISSIDKEEYRKLGVDVKVKSVELETEEVETAEEIKALSGSDIADKFKGFCEQNDYSYNEGMEILKEVL